MSDLIYAKRVFQPGEEVHFSPHAAARVQLLCCSEGCGDRHEVCWGEWYRGEVCLYGSLTIPAEAAPSYFGPLFSVRWWLRFGYYDLIDEEITVGTVAFINPYQQFGLIGNPFVLQPPGVAEKLWLNQGFDQSAEPGQRLLVQFLGEKGAGKSSHLLRWQRQQPGPYYYVPAQGPGRWQRLPVVAGGIVYWDEVDRLPLPLLLDGLVRASYQRCTVVVGTHRSLLGLARLLGLKTQGLHFQRLRMAQLEAWIGRRIAVATRRGYRPSLVFQATELENVIEAANASWREAGFLLHQLAFEHSQRTQHHDQQLTN
jgi:hypothetical protein